VSGRRNGTTGQPENIMLLLTLSGGEGVKKYKLLTKTTDEDVVCDPAGCVA